LDDDYSGISVVILLNKKEEETLKINNIITKITLPTLVKKELKALNKESKLNPELVNYYARQIWKKYRDIADLEKNGIKQRDITVIVKRSIK
jgi:hypothetical protein